MANETDETPNEQAEDIAYTLNHSLYCMATDFLNPPINAATDGYLRWLIPGCGHDHENDHDHVHGRHHEHDHAHASESAHEHRDHASPGRWERVQKASKRAFSKERFIQYAKGEFIGDFGAVPLTIAVQRFFPNFMHGVQKFCEPVVGKLFHWGIARSGKQWAAKEGVSTDSKEYKEHIAQTYDYEMRHFPQAVTWTGFSLGLNTAYQMWVDKTPMPFSHKLALKSSSVLSGVLVTAGVVVAARALVPERMHAMDDWTSRHAIVPTRQVWGVQKQDRVTPAPDASQDRQI